MHSHNWIRQVFQNRIASPSRAQARAATKPSSRRRRLRVEQLETRITPSILGTFELDANVVTGVLGTSGSTTTSHDWDQIHADASIPAPTGQHGFVCPATGGPTSGATTCSFVVDLKNSSLDDIFTGGGSKDTLGIQQGPWLYKAGKPQAKDDITDAYAAAYTDASNAHKLLFAGLDRYDNSGDATAGFWFFKNNIDETTTSSNGGFTFSGTHTDGDILLVSDFTIGGSVATITVFKWVGDDATGSLQQLGSIPNTTFAIVNGSPTSTDGWSFTNKSGETSFAHGEFLEEGIDLTALGLGGCFNSFLAETRSSQSPTATLSDFVLGSFPQCGVQAQGNEGISKIGDPETIIASVTNTGSSPLYIQSISDPLLGNLLAAPVAPVTSITNACGPVGTALAPGGVCQVTVIRTVLATDPDPTTGTITFTLSGNPDGTGGTFNAKADWGVNLFQPSASMTLTACVKGVTPCTTSTSDPNAVITFTYTISDTSSSDSPNLTIASFSDSFGTVLPTACQTLSAPGSTSTFPTSCTFTVDHTLTAADRQSGTLTDTTSVLYHPSGFPNNIAANASASVTLLPVLSITKAVTPGFSSVVNPGGTASFTITVPNTGAGPATNVLLTDQLPDPTGVLTWSVTSSTLFTCQPISASADFLSCSIASLAGGATGSVTVAAVIPSTIFGTGGTGTGNGDPVPLNLFELDGNATTGDLTSGGTSGGSTTPSHDWDQVFADNQTNPPGSSSGAVASSFLTDLTNSRSDDIFTGGGSKDVLGIQPGPWLFTDGKPQAKDDIAHAYAAEYTAANGDDILYAGLDRYDNSGDATAGFWFFHNAISEGAITKGNGTGPFVGTHSDGDILLVSDFTIGGSTATVTVFKWVGDDATGSLQELASVPATTFAIVNSTPISTAWSFKNKSNETQPAHGEFLEEGINLTGLGLGGCFSSFLAETRSSQSPTASLSDFVLGPFKSCSLQLPNSATVSADGVAPITSNTVIITVVGGGSPQLAASLGNNVGQADRLLDDQQLQPVVAQAISQWRAAGVDPQTLATLNYMTVHVAALPQGELGWTLGNDVWIDQTAQGWGWSTDNAPAQGQMDLLTVVTHELGHVLGWGDNAGSAIMATTLSPGVRRIAEVSTSTSTTQAPTTEGTASATGHVSLSSAVAPLTRAIDVTGRMEATLSPSAIITTTRNESAVPLPSPATAMTAVQHGSEQLLAPYVVPMTPITRVESTSGDAALPNDKQPDEIPARVPAAMPVDQAAEDQVGMQLRQQASDAYFTDSASMSDQTDTAVILPGDSAPDTAAVAAALAVALGGWWGVRPAETESRRHFAMDRV